MGIPAFIRASPWTIKKQQQQQKTPKTGGKISAFRHEPNYEKPVIHNGESSEKNNSATFSSSSLEK